MMYEVTIHHYGREVILVRRKGYSNGRSMSGPKLPRGR